MQTRIDPLDQPAIVARFISEDRKVAVMGRWHRRGGCLYCGEIKVIKSGEVIKRFASSMPQDAAGLASYATKFAGV